MRQLLSNISAISNPIANLGNLLIVRAEATRSRGAGYLSALQFGASRLFSETHDALRHWPMAMWGLKSHVSTVSCFVVTKQRQRLHVRPCRRAVS